MATASDDVQLSEHEQTLVEQFIHELAQETAFSDGILVSQNEAIKFLMARKFDVGRAISLFHTHQMMRGKFDLLELDPSIAPLSSELQLGKFTVLQGKGKDGVTICVFYGKKHDPKHADHVTVLRAVVFQLDIVMKCVDVQRNGLALIYDMTNSSYSNFDFDLAMKVLHLLKGGYPARLKAVYILCAPLWFRTSMAVLSTFLRDKIRDRVELIKSHEELQTRIPKDILPEDIGGLSKDSHSGWINQCVNSAKGKDNNHTLSNNFPTEASNNDLTSEPTEEDKCTDMVDNGVSKESPPSPDVSPPPLKTQRTDKAPEKPLPPPPPGENNKPSVENMLNDTLSEMENFLHSHGNVEPKSSETVDSDIIESLNIGHLKLNGRIKIEKEYEQIKGMAPTGSFISTLYPVNIRKNRYNNILAFEESRVRLNILNDDVYSDYINASYVDGYLTEKKFICTQGPLPHTFLDFWRMVWEQKVVVIVMVTRCVERGRTKCGTYWPEEDDETKSFGHLTVTNVACDVHPDFTCTLFELTNSRSRISRRVCHIQFTTWPDFGVLSSADPIIDAIGRIRQYQEEGIIQIREEVRAESSRTGPSMSNVNEMELSGEYENLKPESIVSSEEPLSENEVDVNPPPIVIHCSAGVGRTGTFCCISNSIESYHNSNNIDIYTTVCKIRNQRAFSVQTVHQYQFCYTGILEYIIKDREKKGLDTSEVEALLYSLLQGGK